MFKAPQFDKKNGSLVIVDHAPIEPVENEILIKVHACGMCHGDGLAQSGHMTPDSSYPLIPGHEAAGEIVKLGGGVRCEGWKVGDRVCVGWNGGYCGACKNCREGVPAFCMQHPKFTGIQRDGGYAEYMTARAEALSRIPDGMDYTQAGPLVCAGVTVFNAIVQNSTHLRAGHVVAVVGIGGLGHLGIQFADKMGYVSVAISRGQAKKEAALALGAKHYIDSTSQDVAAELTKFGGAKLIIVTSTGGHDTLASLFSGLDYDGVIVMAGADDNGKTVPVSAMSLIVGRKSIRGTVSGDSRDQEKTMNFAHQFGVKVQTEIFPASKAPEAYEHMISGKGNLRVVINYD